MLLLTPEVEFLTDIDLFKQYIVQNSLIVIPNQFLEMHLNPLNATLLTKKLQADLLLSNLQQVDILLVLYALLEGMLGDVGAVDVQPNEEVYAMGHFLQDLGGYFGAFEG